MNSIYGDHPLTELGDASRPEIPAALRVALGLLAPLLVVAAAIWLTGRGSLAAVSSVSYDDWPPPASDTTPPSDQ